MDFQDLSFYLYAASPSYRISPERLKSILELYEACDLSALKNAPLYDGQTGFPEDAFMEFELQPQSILKKIPDYEHCNITLIGWEEDELLTALADAVEELAAKSNFKTGDISLLTGAHRILNLEDQSEIAVDFSLSLYSENAPVDDIEDLHFRLAKDRTFQESLKQLGDILGTPLKFAFGGS